MADLIVLRITIKEMPHSEKKLGSIGDEREGLGWGPKVVLADII